MTPAPAGAGRRHGETVTQLRLLSWFSPAFPVGGFSYSHGLETAVGQAIVTDGPSLLEWTSGVVTYGTGRSDAILLARAREACAPGKLFEIAERAAALRASAELALESRTQGSAFLRTVRRAWPMRQLEAEAGMLEHASVPITLPIAAALAGRAHDVPARELLPAYLHALAANIVAAGVKLVPLGQTEGQRLMHELERPIVAAARAAAVTPLDDLGTASPAVDLASGQHESQRTRIFRS